MNYNLFNKILVVGILILFIGAVIAPAIGGDYNNEQDTLSLTFYTFDKTGTKECKVELSTDAANIISDMFEELKYKITNDPASGETKILKNDFVEILDVNGLIPQGLSKDYVFSLLNPWWLRCIKYNPLAKHSIPRSSASTVRNDVIPAEFSHSGSAFFCSLAGSGRGLIFTPIIFPRPRLLTLWSAYTSAVSTAANLYTGHGFVAAGGQTGVALGFWGVGLSFAYPGEPAFFGFGGYALLTLVRADDIETYPLNQKPIISNENPPTGTWDVPVSLSELSFRISDPDGDRMSYWVTTDPDVGSGEGHLKKDGVYKIPVSGLEYDKSYSFTVRVSDNKDTTEKQFGFFTEIGPPFDPFDEGWQYRKRITIDHSMVAGNLENFPILISMIDPELRDKAQVDGDDILFMEGSGVASKLYHEIEMYDGYSGELVAWVNIPSVSGSEDTVLYLYYGNSDCSCQQFPVRVWISDYIHVWHLCDSLRDSAGFDDGNDHGTSVVSGKVGMARDFEQNEKNYIDFGDMNQPADGSLTTMTWEAWIKPETQDIPIMTKYNSLGGSHASYYIAFGQGGKFVLCAYSGAGIRTRGVTENPYSIVGEWVYLTSTLNLGGINDIDVFVDGAEVDFSLIETSADFMRNLPDSDDLGRYRPEAGAKYTDAVFDEVRWSKIVRGDDWIKTSFNTMTDPSSFFSVGPEESAH